MRLFSATLATETNTFSPLPTSIENYRESVFFRPGEHPANAPRMCTAPLFVARARAAAEGFTLIEGSAAWAEPGGLLQRAAYETLRDEIRGVQRRTVRHSKVVQHRNRLAGSRNCNKGQNNKRGKLADAHRFLRRKYLGKRGGCAYNFKGP